MYKKILNLNTDPDQPQNLRDSFLSQTSAAKIFLTKFIHNLIHKCFISKDITVMTRAFVTYVRPLLKYASCVWSPYLLKHIKRRVSSETVHQAPP